MSAPTKEQSDAQERTQLDEWVSRFATRNEMAAEYASLLDFYGVEWPTWPALNLAIIDRWSYSGLQYIKNAAWKGLA